MGFTGDVLATAIAAVLAVAGLSKLARASETKTAWSRHGILPPRMVAAAASLTGPVEVAVAAGLIVPETRSPAAFSAVALFVVYTTYLGVALSRGVEGGCGCFGADLTQNVNVGHVIRAAILGAMAVVAATTGTTSVDAAALSLGAATGAGVVFVGSLLVALLDMAPRRKTRRTVSP
ncbi:MAG: hypothetical protein M3323_15625 [Actinomycetota bacterium]|nr:hypothetical protein [Actinomycetota bacterium]